MLAQSNSTEVQADDLLKHYTPTPGYTTIFVPGENALKHVGLGILRLAAGQSLTFGGETGKETSLTILTGTLDAETTDRPRWQKLGGRSSVFDGPTDTLLLPSGSSITLLAATDCEIAVCQAASQETGPVQLFAAKAATIAQRGQPGWQREVRTYIGSSETKQRLILGETINAVGQWSSFPPHKHDRNNLPTESELEEVYLFKFKPDSGFAFQGLYSLDDPATINRAFVVRENDAVAIPRGYHPVAAAPGHAVYYFWALAGIGHELKFYTQDSLRFLEPGV